MTGHFGFICFLATAAVRACELTGFTVVYNLFKEDCSQSSFVSTCIGIEGSLLTTLSFCVLVVSAKERVIKISAIFSAAISLVSAGLFMISSEMIRGCLYPNVILNPALFAVVKLIKAEEESLFEKALRIQEISVCLLCMSLVLMHFTRLYVNTILIMARGSYFFR